MRLRKNKKSAENSEVDNAILTSQYALRRIKSREPAVKDVVSDIVKLHKRNHFAEHIQALISRGGSDNG